MHTCTLSIHCHTHRSLWLFCTPMATQMIPRWHSSSHRRFERSGAGFSALMAHTKPTQPRCGSVGEYPGGCCVFSKVEKNKVCNGCIILHLCMYIYIYKYTPVNKAFLNHKWHIQFYDIYLMRRTPLVIRPDEQNPLLNHDLGGNSPFHLLVGKKNADYWPITFFLFLIILWLVIFSHPQAADPHARAPSSIPWFPNFHLPSHNSTLDTLVAGWWFHIVP